MASSPHRAYPKTTAAPEQTRAAFPHPGPLLVSAHHREARRPLFETPVLQSWASQTLPEEAAQRQTPVGSAKQPASHGASARQGKTSSAPHLSAAARAPLAKSRPPSIPLHSE